MQKIFKISPINEKFAIWRKKFRKSSVLNWIFVISTVREINVNNFRVTNIVLIYTIRYMQKNKFKTSSGISLHKYK